MKKENYVICEFSENTVFNRKTIYATRLLYADEHAIYGVKESTLGTLWSDGLIFGDEEAEDCLINNKGNAALLRLEVCHSAELRFTFLTWYHYLGKHVETRRTVSIDLSAGGGRHGSPVHTFLMQFLVNGEPYVLFARLEDKNALSYQVDLCNRACADLSTSWPSDYLLYGWKRAEGEIALTDKTEVIWRNQPIDILESYLCQAVPFEEGPSCLCARRRFWDELIVNGVSSQNAQPCGISLNRDGLYLQYEDGGTAYLEFKPDLQNDLVFLELCLKVGGKFYWLHVFEYDEGFKFELAKLTSAPVECSEPKLSWNTTRYRKECTRKWSIRQAEKFRKKDKKRQRQKATAQ